MQVIHKIKFSLAVNVMLLALSCLVIFHLSIITGVIPFNIVWGGRLDNTSQMYMFESVSLTINMLALIVVAIKAKYIKPYLHKKLVNYLLFGFVILFALNSVGNMLAESMLEAVLFTPITCLFAIFFYRIAIEK